MITVCCCIIATIFVFSLYFKNGPYHKNSYVEGSLLSSFWGARPLTAVISAKQQQIKLAEVDTLMFNTNEPLKQMVAAVDLDADKLELEDFEGGEFSDQVVDSEVACYTDRGATTERGLTSEVEIISPK